jgi:hypothetical protein
MLHGKEYQVGDLMVVELEELYKGHSSMWKAKIKRFFISEFYGDKKVLSQDDFYNPKTSISSYALDFKHNTTNMVVL